MRAAVERADRARQVHEAAALGVDRAARCARTRRRPRASTRWRRAPRRAPRGSRRRGRVAVDVGEARVAHRRERHQLGAERFEAAQVVLVVEVEGVVEGEADAAARRGRERRGRGRGRRRRRATRRRRHRGDRDDRVEVEPFGAARAPGGEQRLGDRTLARRCAGRGGARGTPARGSPRQTTDDRRRATRAAEQIEVAAAADAVADDAGDAQLGIEAGEARRPAPPGCAPCRRRRRPARTGASSHLAISAVEPSSPVGDAPSKRPITPSMSAMSAPRDARCEGREHRVAPHHPAVEVVAGRPGGARVIGRIEIVGPALEERDAQARARAARGRARR